MMGGMGAGLYTSGSQSARKHTHAVQECVGGSMAGSDGCR